MRAEHLAGFHRHVGSRPAPPRPASGERTLRPCVRDEEEKTCRRGGIHRVGGGGLGDEGKSLMG